MRLLKEMGEVSTLQAHAAMAWGTTPPCAPEGDDVVDLRKGYA